MKRKENGGLQTLEKQVSTHRQELANEKARNAELSAALEVSTKRVSALQGELAGMSYALGLVRPEPTPLKQVEDDGGEAEKKESPEEPEKK